jgi:hypothetical protein
VSEQILKKAPHGTPCNGCGGCCMQTRCPLGEEVFGPGGRCPALESLWPRYVCGLITNPGKYAPRIVMKHGAEAASAAAAFIIGAGSGCDALVVDEKPDNAWLEDWKRRVDPIKAREAVRIWIGNGARPEE